MVTFEATGSEKWIRVTTHWTRVDPVTGMGTKVETSKIYIKRSFFLLYESILETLGVIPPIEGSTFSPIGSSKIPFIKHLRLETELGLKEAKDIIDQVVEAHKNGKPIGRLK